MSDRRTAYSIVMTTAGSSEEASRLAGELVTRRLAACVSIVDRVRSVYRWEGKVQDEAEWLLVIKTRAALYGEVERAILELHSYECPEVLRLDVSGGESRYLAWLGEATAGE